MKRGRRCKKCGRDQWYTNPSGGGIRCLHCRKKTNAAWNKKKRYGLSPEEYETMLVQHQGRCAICGDPPRTTASSLAVDHNHTTGAVRGLLCVLCNTSLERVERAGWLTAATMYLNRYSGTS